MFASQSFLAPYLLTDTALVFVNSQGRRVRGVNVCKYLDSGVSSNVVWVLLEGDFKLELIFETSADAGNAANLLRSAIDSLQINCSLGGGSGPSPTPVAEPISISLSGYNSMVSSNTVVPLQWYDIIDINNLFGRGASKIYRCLALTTNDIYPQGIILSSNDKVVLDLTTNKILDEIVVKDDVVRLNGGNVILDATSNYIFSVNNSLVTAAVSENIYAHNSTLNVDTCSNITGYNSNVSIYNSQNCTFSDVVLDLTSLGVFSDIIVNKTNSTGKEGVENIVLDSLVDRTVLAYQDRKFLKFAGTLNQDVILLVRNISAVVNADFTFYIDSLANLGSYTITVKDFASGDTIATLDTNYTGGSIEVKYDITTSKFFTLAGVAEVSSKTKNSITVISDNQTTFTNVLTYKPKFPSLSQLVVNGCVQEYGNSKDYTITNKTLYWISTDFNLNTTDKIFIIYE